MDSFLTNIQQYPQAKSIGFSFLLIVVLYIFKRILLASISRRDLPRSDKILFKKKISQNFRYVLLVCLVLLWFSQIQGFLVSIFAIAAALVIATKELIMCVTGGLYLRSSGLYKEGHRIEVDELRGFVLEISLVHTKFLEIGPEKNSQQTSGKVITMPNSLLLSHGVKNESYFKGFSIKSFVYLVKDLTKLKELEEALLKKANEICRDYLEEAKMGISLFCEKEGILIPAIDPRTKVIVEDHEVSLMVKLPVKNSHIADTEQELNRFYLSFLNSEKEEA